MLLAFRIFFFSFLTGLLVSETIFRARQSYLGSRGALKHAYSGSSQSAYGK